MTAPVLEARALRLAYDKRVVVDGLDLRVEPGTVTTLVGPNGCGKSTILKSFGRLLRPVSGEVLLEGRPLHAYPTKEVARRLALLPQSPVCPAGMRVLELVMRGRNPHQSWARPWSREDAQAAEDALALTGVEDLAQRDVASLSGGQRQRVWIALVIAQGSPTLLLDEPTTYLDLTHQLEVLRLVRRLNRERGTTTVMVLHDLSLAARYSDRLVAIRGGRVTADGTPDDVLVPGVLRETFDLDARVVADPVTGTPLVVPEEPHSCGGPGTAGASAQSG